MKLGNLSYEEAATLPYGTITAWNLLKKANLTKGKKILINGASGSIGSAAFQLAKNYYRAAVTAVCGTAGSEFVKSIGTDKVIDYTHEDFTKNGEHYDVIFDILGRSSFSACKNSFNNIGHYLLASFKEKQLLEMLWTSMFGSKKVICALSMEKPEDLAFIKKLVEDGKIKTVIDRKFPMEKIAEAHSYV